MDNQIQVVDRLTYNKSINNLGRITVGICLILFLLPSFGLAFLNDIPISFDSFLVVGIPLFMTFLPSAICENLSYAPIIGSGALYVSCITGNVGNMKLPAALNAMSLIDEEPGTEKSDVIALIAVCSASFVTMIITTAGMIFLAPLMAPLLSNAFIQPAFNNLVPAMLGALVIPMVFKNPKPAIVPFAIGIALFFYFGASYSSVQGFLMIPVILISIGASYLIFRGEINGKK